MSEVPWATLQPTIFEKMASCLLKTMYPEADKFEGRGGDGGRDLRILTPSGELIYQIKYLFPRIGSAQGRRTQVERSLKRAARLDPARWTLVVPIDLTEGEHKWLERLRTRFPFPVKYLDATWLNGQMAKHPQIPRYFLEDTNAEVVRLMLELQREKAALTGGLRDASKRIKSLAAQIDQISAYYRVDWSVAGRTSTVEVVPRYKGAERDSPLGIGLVTAFPDTPAGRQAATAYRSFLDYGRPVELKAAHIKQIRFVGEQGLDPHLTRANVRIGPTDEDSDFRRDAVFEVESSSGSPIATLPIVLTGRSIGRKGTALEGADDRKVVSAEIRVNHDLAGSIKIGYKLPERFYPADILPSLRFMAACTAGNVVRLRVLGEGHIDIHTTDRGFRGAAATYRLLTALTHVQVRTGNLFQISHLSQQDQDTIYRCDSLLRGDDVTFEWAPPFEVTLDVLDPSGVRDRLEMMSSRCQFEFTVDFNEEIAGHAVGLGPGKRTVSDAKLAGKQDFVATKLQKGMSIKVKLVPAVLGASATDKLVSAEETVAVAPGQATG